MSSPFGPTGPVPGAGEPVAEELVIGGKPRSRRGTTTAIALIAGGALAGGILASTVGASASNSTTAASAAEAAVSSPAPAASSAAPGRGNRPNFVGPRVKQLTGTVTAVGTDTVGIKTSTATTTYSVTSTSHISINETGPGALSGVKIGDTVFFSTTTDGGTVIADLRDGNVGGPGSGGRGGPGGPGRGGPGFAGVRPLTGTVTAVDTDTVGIKTSTATTTYSVTSTTRIEKNGKATLTDVKVGDTVFFVTTTTGGTVIANLFDGKLPTVAGPGGIGGLGGLGGHGFGPGGPGFGGRMGQPPQAPAASPSASASTAATNT
jgi:hypothetical protein